VPGPQHGKGFTDPPFDVEFSFVPRVRQETQSGHDTSLGRARRQAAPV
jgi:hypothetical protein